MRRAIPRRRRCAQAEPWRPRLEYDYQDVGIRDFTDVPVRIVRDDKEPAVSEPAYQASQ
ncbi:hypothetical protein [Streptomyces hygroscopicus]|uniref:hypothetical protein n=1 Tax=Streptomyces hygroscopicus TaxID=1912 RepID=UPI000AEC6176|nr:hypothetical protein [Streptomyces hygroscopicus]